jgi:hypothetical protein
LIYSYSSFQSKTGTYRDRDALYIYSFVNYDFVHVKARCLLGGKSRLGIGVAQIARRLNLSLAGVSQSVKRGETIVQQKGYNLIDP